MRRRIASKEEYVGSKTVRQIKPGQRYLRRSEPTATGLERRRKRSLTSTLGPLSTPDATARAEVVSGAFGEGELHPDRESEWASPNISRRRRNLRGVHRRQRGPVERRDPARGQDPGAQDHPAGPLEGHLHAPGLAEPACA